MLVYLLECWLAESGEATLPAGAFVLILSEDLPAGKVTELVLSLGEDFESDELVQAPKIVQIIMREILFIQNRLKDK